MPFRRGLHYPLDGGVPSANRNLFTKTSDFSGAPWNSASVQLATSTVSTIEDTSATLVQGRSQLVTLGGKSLFAYTASFDLKAGTSVYPSLRMSLYGGTAVVAEVVLDLTTGRAMWRAGGVGFRFNLVAQLDGWFRASVTAHDNGTNSFAYAEIRPAFATTFDANPDNAAQGLVNVRNAQLEVGRFATAYRARA